MVLEKLSQGLSNVVRKIKGLPVIDKIAIQKISNELQRALIESDVNIELTLALTDRIQKRIYKVDIPPGLSPEKYLIKIIYEELTNFLGERAYDLNLTPGKLNKILLIGIQGSGKTTTAGKLSRFLSKKGYKMGLICADTYRPGAHDQLKQISEKLENIKFYGEPENKNAIKIVKNGLNALKKEKLDVVIIDSAGRHKDEEDLMKEMRLLAKQIQPDEIILVIDGTIGQQCASQAFNFNNQLKSIQQIGSIIVTKLDGSARGGGALSAVAATGAPIKFIGTGEKLEELEKFNPKNFVGRLLGMPDLETFLEKVKEAELTPSKDMKQRLMSGKFTLLDMYEQMKSIRKMGPISKMLEMFGLGGQLPPDFKNLAEGQMDRMKYILESMTHKELEEPKVLNSSRIKRIARGSGTTEREIKDMLAQFNMMKKMIKKFGKDRRFRKGQAPGGMPGFPPGGMPGMKAPKKFKYKRL
ncbi:MAG: signal recognition particle receptor subunit alpha [Candidatus Helarchaeota archaeon]